MVVLLIEFRLWLPIDLEVPDNGQVFGMGKYRALNYLRLRSFPLYHMATC